MNFESFLQDHVLRDTSETINAARQVMDLLMVSTPANQLAQKQINDLLASLPRVNADELLTLGHHDASCPICFTQFQAILTEEEMAIAMDSPAHPIEELGVTKLQDTCGHVFCRKDIGKWIREGRDSCPLCRQKLITPSADAEPADQPHPVEPVEIHETTTFIQDIEHQLSTVFGQSQSASQSGDEERHEYAGMYS